MHIREVRPDDAVAWRERRQELWSDGHEQDIAAYFEGARKPCEIVYVIDRGHGELGGFIELGLRSYAEGCDSSPVAYVEGWYVDDDLRRTGVGRRLMDCAAAWARGQGHTELGSDCGIDNLVSLKAHTAVGFEETDRVICLRKAL